MQNRLRTCRPTSLAWWGTRGSGMAKITVTLCTRTGSSWTNHLMVNPHVYSEFTVALYCEKRSLSDPVCTFFRFHWQTHHSQNAVARHRLRGSWESCKRCRAALHSALEFHQGDKNIYVSVCVKVFFTLVRTFMVKWILVNTLDSCAGVMLISCINLYENGSSLQVWQNVCVCVW